MEKYIEIIALIYQSTEYLEFISEQMKSNLCTADGWIVGTRIIANDATDDVINALQNCGVSYSIYQDRNPQEYYLNRVYRCHNFGAITSGYPNICFINSDILMSENWLDNLLKHHDGVNIPCCRLVESGKMPSGQYGLSMPLGTHPKNIRYDEWFVLSKTLQEPTTHLGGLYGPVVYETKRFIESGMYPEGNIYADGVGTRNGEVLKSSDDYYFHDVLEPKYGMKHITVFDSICYHIQEGEKSNAV